jgi:four helix bundle protein
VIGDSKKRPHQRLDVWRDAMDLVARIDATTAGFSEHERDGLAARMRRAAVGAPSKIVERAARRSKAELRRVLSIARGSFWELDTSPDIAMRLQSAHASPDLQDTQDRTFAGLNAWTASIGQHIDESRITHHESRSSHAR